MTASWNPDLAIEFVSITLLKITSVQIVYQFVMEKETVIILHDVISLSLNLIDNLNQPTFTAWYEMTF